MWGIFCCLSKHNGRSPVIVCRLSLHDEGIKHLILKLDIDMVKMYQHTKIDVPM